MEKWREFEMLIARIHQGATPNSLIEHDHKVVGKSGAKRQIDVSIAGTVGIYRSFIVIECKYHKRRIGIGRVGEFWEKLDDVGATQGVMVSSRGFSRDAQLSARRHNITLLSYRDAEASDWSIIGDPAAWVRVITRLPTKLMFWGIGVDGTEIRVAPETPLYSPDRSISVLVDDIVKRIESLGQIIADTPPGPFLCELDFDEPACVEVEGQLRQLRSLQIRALIQAFAHVVNAPLASGHILERAPSGEPLYREFQSQSFRLTDVIAAQQGQPLSREEYLAMMPLSFQVPDELMGDHVLFRYRIHVPSPDSPGEEARPS